MKGKVAAAVLINNQGKLLFYLRDNKPNIPYPNTWALMGGHLKRGEEVLDALKREIFEEIGIEIKNPIFLGNFDDLVGNDVIIYKVKICEKIKDLELTEGKKLEYFDLDEFLNLENVPRPLKGFLEKNKTSILG